MGTPSGRGPERPSCYEMYVLGLLVITYFSSQLDRFLLPVCTEQIAQNLGYGNMDCEPTDYLTSNDNITCSDYETEDSCEINDTSGNRLCLWQYTGTGQAYDLLVGPIFTVVNSVGGVVVGLLADYTNRKNLLAISICLWSCVTMLTGLVKEYWQLAVLQFTLGLCESGAVPLPASLIASYFSQEHRSTAMGVFYFGIYTGLGVSFALGNLASAYLSMTGWRKLFYITGLIGFPLALLVGCTIKEPVHDDVVADRDGSGEGRRSLLQLIKASAKEIFQAPLLLLILSSSVRNVGQYTWVNYTESYFLSAGGSEEVLAVYLPWVIAVGGGTSVFVGGIIADRLTRKYGPPARLRFIAGSLILAAPLCVTTLFISQPSAYYTLLATLMFGEVWISVSIVAVVEMVPSSVRSTAVAFNVLCISNTAALAVLLVAPLQNAFENTDVDFTQAFRDVLVILWPGMYLLGALLYIFTASVLLRHPKFSRPNAEYDELDGVSLKNHASTSGTAQ